MLAEQSKQLEQINRMQENLSLLWFNYWQQYSNLSTWQFWFYAALLIVPLIVLYVFIDKRRALQIGFFGFNVHVWFTYIDAYGIKNGLWSYPYQAIPSTITSIALDASFIPVVYMFVYQWTLHKHKNYYLYATALSVLLSFLFKPALSAFGLFQLYKGANYFYLLLGYLTIMLISKWITNLFVIFRTKPQKIRSSRKSSACKDGSRTKPKPNNPLGPDTFDPYDKNPCSARVFVMSRTLRTCLYGFHPVERRRCTDYETNLRFQSSITYSGKRGGG
ncbi:MULTISPECIES: CBO0543 family protein [Paenibacillus]|uniref:CBO0543 family protein n=1 Tax=Paenibacillus TaxID=44249 RepID=UPI00191635E9|nr:CBO0543 family protein [Paenibacillus sp. EPM92]